MSPPPFRLVELIVEPLSVPLVDPFVIASGRVDATRSVLVRARLEGPDGRVAKGLGEGSALPPVTREDQADLLRSTAGLAAREPAEFASRAHMERWLDEAFPRAPVARCGVEMALQDAFARLEGVPVFHALAGAAAQVQTNMETDITLPILPPARLGELAREWWGRGFRSFKVKVGRALDEDVVTLQALHAATPHARVRLDANAGLRADEALELVKRVRALGLALECFEQPCGVQDWEGLARVTAEAGVAVIADESLQRLEDVETLVRHRAASGVNLKLAKLGGLGRALAVGRAAKARGLSIMVGGMVETRLGMTAAAHLVAALGGVELPDLDTAWLLREDRFRGGYRAHGPRYQLGDEPGLGVEPAPS